MGTFLILAACIGLALHKTNTWREFVEGDSLDIQ